MKSWDIFCRVIDNYGDIGVCWRLARQLANEYPFQVRLWVDELAALKMIWPEAQLIPHQHLANLDVHQWTANFPSNVAPADVVIEAFACDIPEIYLRTMAEQKASGKNPVWINLDYLSAEDWVEGCHKMQSIHPATGLRKTFFFPGFTEKTGGLIREKDIASNRPLDGLARREDECLLVSLFAYENAAIESLIEAWANGKRQVHCLIPQGRILNSINRLLTTPLAVGEPQIKGSLTLETIAFMNQLQYDQLLQNCDLNFVRGEDSLVRAIWAGKPFVWQIYQQEENAHMVKLQAFLDIYTSDFPEELREKLTDFWLRWNKQDSLLEAWDPLILDFDGWIAHNRQWTSSKQAETDLVSRLLTMLQH